MKKIISILSAVLLILIAGCQFIVVTEEKANDSGITPINFSEIFSSEEKTSETPAKETTEEKTESVVKEIPTVKVVEGDVISFPNLKATDPDGDKITYRFSAPLDADGEWKTKEGDAGERTVTITASDGTNEVKQEVLIIVEQANKVPTMAKIADLKFKEGETIKLTPNAVDPEGKPVTITYSGWMNSDTKNLDYNSAGDYIVRVTASDGVKSVYQDVKITVEDLNRPPVFVDII